MTKEEFLYGLQSCGYLRHNNCTWYEHDELIKCFEDLGLLEPQSFKWCTDCKEYDQEKHCCHRYSKVIRDTVEEMKQEPKSECEQDHAILKAYSDGANEVLDKIRAEIEKGYCEVDDAYDQGRNYGLYIATQIIDKYRKE
jgi:hypothetical protein